MAAVGSSFQPQRLCATVSHANIEILALFFALVVRACTHLSCVSSQVSADTFRVLFFRFLVLFFCVVSSHECNSCNATTIASRDCLVWH